MTGKEYGQKWPWLIWKQFSGFCCKNQGKPSDCRQESLWDKIWSWGTLVSAEHLPFCTPFTVLHSGHLYPHFNGWDIFFPCCPMLCQMQALRKLLSLMDVTAHSSDGENSQQCKSDISINTVICYRNIVTLVISMLYGIWKPVRFWEILEWKHWEWKTMFCM